MAERFESSGGPRPLQWSSTAWTTTDTFLSARQKECVRLGIYLRLCALLGSFWRRTERSSRGAHTSLSASHAEAVRAVGVDARVAGRTCVEETKTDSLTLSQS